MRRTIAYLLLAAVTVLSCTDERDRYFSSETISFGADDVISTKALLTNATLKTVGNRLHVVDVLTGFSGSASWMSGNLYIDDEIAYSGNPVWDYYSGKAYPWTTDGTHQFFSWLSYDTALGVTADTFFGQTVSSGFDASSRTLSLPALEMTTETRQFDFMYANTSNYIMPHTSTDPVPLTMQHLFSAISLELRNESNETVKVHSVSISGLKNKKSATIDFVTTPQTVSQPATNGFIDNSLFNTTQNLALDETYDILARSKNTTAEYRLIWPQTAEELAPSNVNDYSTYPITVVYEYAADDEHIQHTAHLRFPEGASFNPGVRYAYTLLFTQKHIQLNFRVNPWTYDLNEWSFDKQTISEATTMDFDNTYAGYNKSDFTVTINNGLPVTGSFKLVNPAGAIWSIEPVGDVAYFNVSPNQGQVVGTNDPHTFVVTPNLDPSLDRTSDKKLKFHVYVTFTDGTVHDANSELYRDEWTIILPKN